MQGFRVFKFLSLAIAPLLTVMMQFPLSAHAQQNTNCDVQVVGKERGSRVNLRNGFGEPFSFVLVGQSVNMLNNNSGKRLTKEDKDGYTWYFVEYLPSSTRGWIREDFLAQQCNQAL
ncbi:MAG: hypothetical protein NW214_07740 [Pseudanabaenaceae cyanobacterium bins.39]|nr:hypothetical protein [Pseudanabaenaceae cyanobacterium bins.39]